jgi:hypothetical protein
MQGAEEYAELYEWLHQCYQQDEADLHTLQMNSTQCKNLLTFLIENCR